MAPPEPAATPAAGLRARCRSTDMHCRSGRWRCPTRSVCAVAEGGEWRPVGKGEITVDSVAEESVCPKWWGEAFQTRRPSRWLRFVSASGGPRGHYGEKTATFKAAGNEAAMSLGFQVSDAQKPLADVWRIAEKGNLFQFGSSDEDNFIRSIEAGTTIMMVRKAGSYVIEVDYVAQQSGFARPANMYSIGATSWP